MMMQRSIRGVFALLLCLLLLPAAASEIGKEKTYPEFQVGVTGAWVSIQPGHVMRVERVDADSHAEGQLRPGDIIREANNRPIEGEDPREPLGQAVTEAEARGGLLSFAIERDGRKGTVRVRIPVLGEYAETWPLNCEKSNRIVRDHAQWLVSQQNDEGWFGDRGELWNVMGALFVLSTGERAYDDNVRRYAHALAATVETKPSTSTWHLGYHLIFLCEYYLQSGDETVLPAIEAACKLAAEGQVAGAWAHGMFNASVGYVQSGLMNSAGVTLFIGLTLARECGITVHEEAYQRSLVFFYRMAGHGSICYGDHRAEIYPDTNGRNAAIACAFSLLDQQPYQDAAGQLAMMVADSYDSFEAGHTGGGFNVLWRGVVMPLVPEHHADRVRLHMKQLAWYYDLARLPGGGFSMLPSPPDTTRYTGEQWGRGLGLTYTAPLKTLRITGGPRTRFSKPTPALDALPWGNERDTVFVATDHAEGFGRERMLPHEAHQLLKGKDTVPAAELAQLMRHFNPYIRTLAARKLAQMKTNEAYDQIERALRDGDPRVRRAGCDAISGYDNWGRGGSTGGIPRDTVSRQFVPHIEAILKDPNVSLWEADGALWALNAALPDDIRRNRPHIDRYEAHEEWYLRESAYWALVGLGRDITGPEFLELAERYSNARHVFERGSMDGGINYLLKKARVELEPEVMAQYIQVIASQMYEAAIAVGYDEMAARHEAAHRTMMVISNFKNPPYQLIARDLARYMDGWTPGNQHGDWLIVGNKWQPGLAKIANDLGADAGPIIDIFKHCLQQDYWDPRSKSQLEVREAMQNAIDTYATR